MKPNNVFRLVCFQACFGFVCYLQAQTFAVLHPFSGGDSANPAGALAIAGDRLYGTTSAYWSSRNGTVFTVKIDGTGFEALHAFSTPTYNPGFNVDTNSDGALPMARLLLLGDTLYGTAHKGGMYGLGTVFSIKTNGTGFTTLHHFSSDYTEGANPWAGLISSGDTLYGTTYAGGDSSVGTVFALKTDGNGFRIVHHFDAYNGAAPMADLILDGNTLYGTANNGGSSSVGTVFKVNTDGTGFTNLHVFSGAQGANPANAGLVLTDGILYGTTFMGGSAGYGTVFKLETNGNSFATLHSFSAPVNSTNDDGANPASGLVLLGNTLYGATGRGGHLGSGTIFSVKTNGADFTALHSFTAQTDGVGTQGGLTAAEARLYGVALAGYGAANPGHGTIFSLSLTSLSPTLSIATVPQSLVFTWPTNSTGFRLQWASDLTSTAAWVTVSQQPVVVNGRNMITLPRESANQLRFYRIIR